MAGTYRRKNAVRRNNGTTGQFLLIVVSIIIGYVLASFVDFNCLSTWLNTHLSASTASQPIPAKASVHAQLPKPKFEFYTLLANDKAAVAQRPAPAPAPAPVPTPQVITPANVPATVNKETPLPVPSITSVPSVAKNNPIAHNKDSYLVQVGSFRSMKEAQRMKATLLMKGFDVGIHTATAQQINWYRVIIGPFSSKVAAQQAQQAFARSEHIAGMVRRMDA